MRNWSKKVSVPSDEPRGRPAVANGYAVRSTHRYSFYTTSAKSVAEWKKNDFRRRFRRFPRVTDTIHYRATVDFWLLRLWMALNVGRKEKKSDELKVFWTMAVPSIFSHGNLPFFFPVPRIRSIMVLVVRERYKKGLPVPKKQNLRCRWFIARCVCVLRQKRSLQHPVRALTSFLVRAEHVLLYPVCSSLNCSAFHDFCIVCGVSACITFSKQ